MKEAFSHFGCCFRLRSFPIDTFVITKLISEIVKLLPTHYFEHKILWNLWCSSKLLYNFTSINIFWVMHFPDILTNLSVFALMGSYFFRRVFPSIDTYWRVCKIIQGGFFLQINNATSRSILKNIACGFHLV